MPKESNTPTEIEKLVTRFDEHVESYKSGAYNEAQLRQEFLNPFFEALGWDVHNRKGYAEAYKEVIHEDSINVGGATKAPDYCFRIGGTRKFFVEAKKPSVNIKEDINPSFQLKRYAWSSKLPLSILTDFEEMAVYECLTRPEKKDKVTKGRLLYITYQEYLDRWDEIASVFSREAILKGSFDKYAAGKKHRRGTAEVDDEFLKEIESWRELLAKNIALRNPSITQRELNYAVQQTIDRIVFLRICEDRGIEDYGRLMALQNGPNVYRRMMQIFQQADDRYNSGLFHFTKEKDRPGAPDELTPSLNIDDKALKAILKRLYYPESPYEFSVLPADILGQTYERFLGKVIRLTAGHQARVEDKPEVRKAGGVYYTPTYIVDYIVKNTVGKLLEGSTPKKAEKLSILDPACGSGSFLIGAYQYVLDWHLDFYIKDEPDKRARRKNPVIYQSDGGDWRLTASEKKRILLNNIYGVDIDQQAVEVTKLSLLLKVLEGENNESLQRQLKMFQERALPDLRNNIKCGNSLVSHDYYHGKPHDALNDDERFRLNSFDWHGKEGFPLIKKDGGFDAVIGNPPYVRQESLGDMKEYFQKNYAVYHGIADLYAYFIERGVSLLKKGGLFSYIVANKWMRANYGEPLRKWLKEQHPVKIIDFGDLPVFQKVTTYPCVMVIKKDSPPKKMQAVNFKTLDFESIANYEEEHRFDVALSSLVDEGWSLVDEKQKDLIFKLKSVGVPLKEYIEGNIYRGILTGLNKAFVIDEDIRKALIREDSKSEEIIKPFLVGRDIKRYQKPQNDKYLIFTRRGVEIKRYRAILEYLRKFKTELTPKPKDWKGKTWLGRKSGNYKWYEIQDTIDYYKEFEKPKIIYPNISKKPEFLFDKDKFYTNQKCFIISVDDKYLLGILNSSLTFFLYRLILPKLRGDFYEPSYVYFKGFPIRTIDFSKSKEKDMHDKMVSFVDQMLDLNKKLQSAKTDHDRKMLQRQIDYTDKQIDTLVYELYGLTEDEIKIVEEST